MLLGNDRQLRETTGNHGKLAGNQGSSRETTGNHGKLAGKQGSSRETAGNHGNFAGNQGVVAGNDGKPRESLAGTHKACNVFPHAEDVPFTLCPAPALRLGGYVTRMCVVRVWGCRWRGHSFPDASRADEHAARI